jgi:hypothetical protein
MKPNVRPFIWEYKTRSLKGFLRLSENVSVLGFDPKAQTKIPNRKIAAPGAVADDKDEAWKRADDVFRECQGNVSLLQAEADE